MTIDGLCSVPNFFSSPTQLRQQVMKTLHRNGIHSITLQPEFVKVWFMSKLCVCVCVCLNASLSNSDQVNKAGRLWERAHRQAVVSVVVKQMLVVQNQSFPLLL